MNKMKAGWIGFLKYDESFWQNVEKLAKLGYRGVEGGEILLGKGNEQEQVDRFYGLGLQVLTASLTPDDLTEDKIQTVINRAKLLKTNRITVWAGQINSSFWDAQPDYDKFMQELVVLEKAAKIAAEDGIKVTYHTHFQEFTEHFQGVQAYNYMFLHTEKLCFELDVAWATYAGECPVDIMTRFAHRIPVIHVKDYRLPKEMPNPNKPEVIFTGLGTGVVDTVKALECAHGLGMEWVVAEQDHLRNLSPIETLTMDYYHMKETGFVE